MHKDHFKNKASTYDNEQLRIDNVNNIAKGMIKKINFIPKMKLMDFGSGTGLLLEHIAPLVKKITAVDISPSMNKQLENKRQQIKCELEVLPINLIDNSKQHNLNQTIDGIISSMTLHHIKDIQVLFNQFHAILKSKGFIAIADLYLEDGHFHTQNTGVFHFGFEQASIMAIAKKSGFINICFQQVSKVKKPQGDYPVFLLTALKV
ncbi:class I SAM-dependent DNA methyltransferase [Shewanella surugensis]|uniref:Methyltransferase domain-containing protein n=1 Tax=Shewanella surugensis TaxID=212020 RepID=A0ABT0LF69_9GAMM|nr:class I SAM-dependent methyltransferase [Shewanella surugensis]MCL1126204.1 methyltransferase domain-containing protein [Shewanella surugensis]